MLFVFCAVAEAQQQAKVPRIGYLAPGSQSGYSSVIDVPAWIEAIGLYRGKERCS
jgi:hypothetical protein